MSGALRPWVDLKPHCVLEWQNIGCSYKQAEGLKHVLQGVWGTALPGEMQVKLAGVQGWSTGHDVTTSGVDS